jgi:hypothetical protein
MTARPNTAPAAEALTGRMPSVCMYCGDTYGHKPCLPAQDGQPSHGICSAPECRARFDSSLAGVRFSCRPGR